MDGNVSAVPYIDLLFVMLVIAVRKGKKKKKRILLFTDLLSMLVKQRSCYRIIQSRNNILGFGSFGWNSQNFSTWPD